MLINTNILIFLIIITIVTKIIMITTNEYNTITATTPHTTKQVQSHFPSLQTHFCGDFVYESAQQRQRGGYFLENRPFLHLLSHAEVLNLTVFGFHG